MVICLNDNQRTCIDMVRDIICSFPGQTRDELLLFFPTFKGSLLDKSLEILIKMKHITSFEYDGQQLYCNGTWRDKTLEHIKDRKKTKPSLDLLRLLINSTDEEGILVNEIPYFTRGDYPRALYFQCNKKLFEVYDFINEEKDLLQDFINTIDMNTDPKFFPNNDRIVLVKDINIANSISIRNLKIIAYFDGSDNISLYKAGDNNG